MNLNRHNYEEYFLLYVDNELSAAERKTVELFVEENADLKAELNVLQKTVFNAEKEIFTDKDQLIKQEFTALQQNILLYIDDELSGTDKLGVEKVLTGDGNAAKEFSLLRQTKLQPDTSIVFYNKKILYHKQSGIVRGLYWRRIAVAAVLLGLGTWLTLTFIKTGKPAVETVAGKNDSNKNITVPAINEQVVIAQPKKTVDDKTVPFKESTVAKETVQKNKQPGVTHLSENNVQPKNIKVEDDFTAINKPDNNLPKPDYNNFNNNNRNSIDVANVIPLKEPIENLNSGINNSVTPANNEAINNYATTAGFTENNNEESSNNRFLYMNEENVKKTKLGGFFRKVKRMVERTANVNTGNSIKVAGFQIAIK